MCQHCRDVRVTVKPRAEVEGEDRPALCECIEDDDTRCSRTAVLFREERSVDKHLCDKHFDEMEKVRHDRGLVEPIDSPWIREKVACDFVQSPESPGAESARCAISATRATFWTYSLRMCLEHAAQMDEKGDL